MTRSPDSLLKRPVLLCKQCGYDANQPTAERCEVCGLQLREQRKNIFKTDRFVRGLALSTTILCALGIGGYLIWKNQTPTSTSANAPASSTSLSQYSDIRFYPSLREIPNIPSGLFNYGGAQVFAPMKTHGMNDAITQAHPDFQLRYTEPLNQTPGSGTGIDMLIDEELSIAQSGRALNEKEVAKAKERGFLLESVPVAIDGIAFFTNPNLKIAGLSLDQVQGIFTGNIKNWRQVGGPDLAIVPVSLEPKTTSTIQLLLEGLKDAQLSSKAQIMRDYTSAIRTVATTPGAISYASAPSAVGQKSIRLLQLAPSKSKQYVSVVTSDNQVNIAAFRDGSYPFTRRLFVIFRRDGTVEERAGVAYANSLLTPEGQQIIEKSGFVAIRD